MAVNIWMLMTSIFVVNGRIYHYRFKCNYLKNQIHFCAFYCILLPFLLNLHYIWNILKKNWTSYLTYFWNYWLWKMSLAWCIKGPVSENTSAVKVLNAYERLISQKHFCGIFAVMLQTQFAREEKIYIRRNNRRERSFIWMPSNR